MRRVRASRRCAMTGGIVLRRRDGVASMATFFKRGTSAPHNSQITQSGPQRLNKKCLVYSLRLSAHPSDDSMDEEQIREFSEKMSERIASLEDKNDKLLE